MRNTNFVTSDSELYKIAPTAYSPTRGVLLHGRPLDAMADLYKGNGTGNAGIFSTVGDVLRFMRIMLAKGQINNEFRVYQK
jgi:hypothetical protein